jgi:hypothetical protein
LYGSELKSAEVTPDSTGRIPPPSEWGDAENADIRYQTQQPAAPPNDEAERKLMRRMIDEYHRRKGPLPRDPDELQAIVRLDWDCIEPVLKTFFDLTAGGYVQPELQARIDRRRR